MPQTTAESHLLEALALRLGWRPKVYTFRSVLPRWLWAVLRPLLGSRSMVIGRTLYVGDPGVLHVPMLALRLIAHEGAHWIIGRKLPFYTVYFLQQLIMLVGLGVTIAANVAGRGTGWEWLVPLVLLCLPWPSPNRAEIEAEGYALGIVALRAYGLERKAAINGAVDSMASATYWMTPWPFERLLRRSYAVMLARSMSEPRRCLLGWERDVRDIAEFWAKAEDD